MSEAKKTEPSAQRADSRPAQNSKNAVLTHAANELIFAVVGHVGSGTSTVAASLQKLLESSELPGGKYDTVILKARDCITDWAQKNDRELPQTAPKALETVITYQNLGDDMRKSTQDYAVVAKELIKRIREVRARKTGAADPGAGPVKPDGEKRAYILDSIRHPAEVALLRHVYQEAFILVGVVCEEDRRLRRVMKKYDNAGEANARLFMERDAKAKDKHGQKVSDAFHLSDFFIDNTVERLNTSGASNKYWDINEKLSRLIKIIGRAEIVRPEVGETAMHHAYSAAMRSACLSRQVGAALVDASGNVIATGTNEVPRAGGGVYGDTFDEGGEDHRCAFRKMGDTPQYCSNTKEQFEIIDKLFAEVPELKALDPIRKNELRHELKKGRVGDLLEFSRAVHAEMDAVLSAGREGNSTVGARLYVTTFPCHYCARHMVSAGVDEVQYIEPYPKSQALSLHADSIQVEATEWVPPSQGGTQVLFRPFVGVAPHLYRRAFQKDRELKNDMGELAIGLPEWGSPWHLRSAGYTELEAALFKIDS